MHLDVLLILASAVVGLLVGITGTGGGAVMTPMLVLLFGVAPSAAIASDLVATLVMRPAGALVHWRRHTVQRRVAALLCVGSVPSAFLGTFVMDRIGTSANAELDLRRLLGVALVVGGAAMIARPFLGAGASSESGTLVVRTIPTVLTGVVGGFMVGLTSVGAGSLMMAALVLLYPSMSGSELVGTDLAQSVPLAFGATMGSLLFGHVGLDLTVAVIIGAVPATFVGSLISSRRANRFIRPLITVVVLMSGLKYLGLGSDVLVVALVAVVALALASLRRSTAGAPRERVTQ
ncbi:MAG: sulfite exporter TauE/SafE family protein [Actinomycetales bacterium]|nr:sulfite exporter TauE/SafE family protein [Actinomycetales bacterium]